MVSASKKTICVADTVNRNTNNNHFINFLVAGRFRATSYLIWLSGFKREE